MGYAGAHVSGVHTLDELLLLDQALIAQRDRITSLAEWLNNGMPAGGCRGAAGMFHPDDGAWELGRSDVTATRRERLRYALFSAMHRQFFSRRGWLSKALGWSMTRPIWQTAVAAHALHAVERMVKRPLVGCDTCGSCRLQETLYVCPETCPRAWRTAPVAAPGSIVANSTTGSACTASNTGSPNRPINCPCWNRR